MSRQENPSLGLYKQTARRLQWVYEGSNQEIHKKYAQRIKRCGYNHEGETWYCRVRLCPTCQWRRSLRWKMRFTFELKPRILQNFPENKFIFLTLTVKNCKVKYLRTMLRRMHQAWGRLSQLSIFPAIGWIRSTEVTMGRDGSAHPHLHILLMVSPLYSKKEREEDYIDEKGWSQLWKECLREDYDPVVHIQETELDMVSYFVKPTALNFTQDREIVRKYILSLTDNLHRMRSLDAGGALKTYLKDWHTDYSPEGSKKGKEKRKLYGTFSGNKMDYFTDYSQLSTEEHFVLVDEICERLEKERGMCREDALAFMKEKI